MIFATLKWVCRKSANNYSITSKKCSSTRKNSGPKRYPKETILDPRNVHEEKSWTDEILTRKILNPQKNHHKKSWTQQKPTRKNFGPTNAHWQDGNRPMRLTVASESRNLVKISRLLNISSSPKYFQRQGCSISFFSFITLIMAITYDAKSWAKAILSVDFH